MKNFKKFFALALAVVLFACVFAGCSGGKNEKTLKLGFDASFPPMGFKDNSGNYVGFDLDVAKEVVKHIDGYDKLELVPIKWDSKDAELKNGNIDFIWNGFTMHVDNRDNDYAWTTPYMNNAQVVCVKKGSPIVSTANLAGKVVGVQKDSSGLAALNDTPAIKDSVAKIEQFADYDTALMNLESGAVDAVVIDKVVINYKIADGNDKFTVIDGEIAKEEYGVAFLKTNTALRDKVQAALEELNSDGTLAKISTEWFGSDITTIGK